MIGRIVEGAILMVVYMVFGTIIGVALRRLRKKVTIDAIILFWFGFMVDATFFIKAIELAGSDHVGWIVFQAIVAGAPILSIVLFPQWFFESLETKDLVSIVMGGFFYCVGIFGGVVVSHTPLDSDMGQGGFIFAGILIGICAGVLVYYAPPTSRVSWLLGILFGFIIGILAFYRQTNPFVALGLSSLVSTIGGGVMWGIRPIIVRLNGRIVLVISVVIGGIIGLLLQRAQPDLLGAILFVFLFCGLGGFLSLSRLLNDES